MTSKPVHDWSVVGTVQHDGVEFFQYRCKRCNHTTLNGQPLRAPFNTECTTSRRASVNATT